MDAQIRAVAFKGWALDLACADYSCKFLVSC